MGVFVFVCAFAMCERKVWPNEMRFMANNCGQLAKGNEVEIANCRMQWNLMRHHRCAIAYKWRQFRLMFSCLLIRCDIYWLNARRGQLVCGFVWRRQTSFMWFDSRTDKHFLFLFPLNSRWTFLDSRAWVTSITINIIACIILCACFSILNQQDTVNF